MSITNVQQDFDFLIQRASEILKSPGKAVVLDGMMERAMLRAARLESRHGLMGREPLVGFSAARRGHSMVTGMECYRLKIDGQTVRVVKVLERLTGDQMRPAQDFCVVPTEHITRFYRFLRHKIRHQPPPLEPAPIMSDEAKTRLWDNTIGFLTYGRDLLKQYDVPQKRGVLLMGDPGNGKTMACRWLFSHCRRKGLTWRMVRPEEYERARSDGMVQTIFSLDEPGIILFDDFDLAVRNREEFGATAHHSTFLGELDGLEAHQGVVYIFTSNARLKELDPAFLRPGRIDQVIEFARPPMELRRRLIRELWHADIVAGLDVEAAVLQTEGLSFAEMTELKKLLVLRYLDAKQWDWEWAWKTFQTDVRYAKKSPPILGFARARLRDAADRHAAEHMLNQLTEGGDG